MPDPIEQLLLSPAEEQREHQMAILSTIPEPKYERVWARDISLANEGANTEATLSSARVDLYADYWASCIAGCLFLVKRGRKYEPADGRHRVMAVRKRVEAFQFHALVWEGLTIEQEAALFWYLNQERRNPSAAEKHVAAALSGDPVARAVQDTLDGLGLRSKVNAIAAMQTVVKRGGNLYEGQQALEFSLRFLTACFPTDDDRYNAVLVRGVGRFFLWYGNDPRMDLDLLVKRVQGKGYLAVHLYKRAAEMTGSTGEGADSNVARLLRQAWNAKPGWTLPVR